AALAQILLGDPRQVLVEDHHPVPLGALAPLAAGLVAPGLGRGQGEVHDLGAVLGAAHLRVPPEIAHQDDLVDAARHRLALICRRSCRSPLRCRGTALPGCRAVPFAGSEARRRNIPHRPPASKPRQPLKLHLPFQTYREAAIRYRYGTIRPLLPLQLSTVTDSVLSAAAAT